jgi:hypothetical protein
MPSRTSALVGGVLGAFSVVALVGSAYASSLPLFIAASLLFGGSSALLFLGGLGLVAANAAAHHRAGTLSMAYLYAYVGQVITSVGLGVLATEIGLRAGLDIVGPLLLVLAVATILVATRVGRRGAAGSARSSVPTCPSEAISD